MNLLKDNWIPVKTGNEEVQLIKLQDLLCQEEEWQLCLNRDDMELAALQLLVCLVQVIFIPENKRQLLERWQKPLTSEKYEAGIQPFLDWFDLLHPKYPFMQIAKIDGKKGDKNWSSLQKLFVGLPEGTSKGPSSNAFFNEVKEIETSELSFVAIALFQQATNGLSLGGKAFSCGLKGSMPLTTLLRGDTVRGSIWLNILSQEALYKYAPHFLVLNEDYPVWVREAKRGKEKEVAHEIGLLRGLFWQPAQIRLTFDDKQQPTGFVKKVGLCKIKGIWHHPHTPVDLTIFATQDAEAKKRPFLSARADQPLWSDLLSFLYSRSQFNPEKREGFGRALVVQQYHDAFARITKTVNLGVGGYVKGKSAESLAARRHEMYGLDASWNENFANIQFIVDLGISIQKILLSAVIKFGEIGVDREKPRKKKNKLFNGLKLRSSQIYFRNSEAVMHSILRNINIKDAEVAKQKFSKIAIGTFDFLITPMMSSDPMMIRAGIKSRAFLIAGLKKLEG